MEEPSMEGGEMAPPIPEEEPIGNDQMGMEGGMPEEGDDSTMSIINQLSDEDKESVRAYAESMLDKKGGNEAENKEQPPMDDEQMAPPIPEGRTFTKKQLKEEFGVKVGQGCEKKQTTSPMKKKIRKNSPFNPPMFN